MTNRLGLSLNASQALGIIWLVVAMFFLPTEKWTSLPISEALAADHQLAITPDWDSVTEPCIEGITSHQTLYRPRGPILEPGPLVIGCKLADCGPGTDGPGLIDLRITLTGVLAERTILEFENMTVREAAHIAVRGNARHVKGTTRFEVRSGTTVLRGFGTSPNLRPPVAIPHLTLNRNALEALKHAAKVDDLLASSKSSVTLIIEQFRGPMTVNRYAVSNSFRFCRSPLLPTLNSHGPFTGKEVFREPPIKSLGSNPNDFVDFGTPPQGAVTILAPGRMIEPITNVISLQCRGYDINAVQFGYAAATVDITNHFSDRFLLQSFSASSASPQPGIVVLPGILANVCHSEVVVYGMSSALAVVQPVIPPWTDAPGDRVPITLPPPLTVPVAADQPGIFVPPTL